MRVSFFGVRGSCPCAGPEYGRVGGNTSCVLVTAGGAPPLVLDLGTGMRALGDSLRRERGDAPIEVNALLTHLHFDHILGLPFFSPLHETGAHLTIHGPSQEGESLRTALQRAVQPPYFPVEMVDLGGVVDVQEMPATPTPVEVGGFEVRAARVDHPGDTLGFRVEAGGRVLVYLPDHQAPPDRSTVPDAIRELCDGADLLLHDAQYTDEEFDAKPGWGHSTVQYAVRVAAESGVRRLFLFHHDPSHSDRDISEILEQARKLPDARRIEEVSVAREGATEQL